MMVDGWIDGEKRETQQEVHYQDTRCEEKEKRRKQVMGKREKERYNLDFFLGEELTMEKKKTGEKGKRR